jgi:hypothetical protein
MKADFKRGVRTGRNTLRIQLPKGTAGYFVTPALVWPVLLRSYVAVKEGPLPCDAGMWLCYVVAKRVRAEKVEDVLSRTLRKLSDKGMKYTVKVSAGEEQAK